MMEYDVYVQNLIVMIALMSALLLFIFVMVKITGGVYFSGGVNIGGGVVPGPQNWGITTVGGNAANMNIAQAMNNTFSPGSNKTLQGVYIYLDIHGTQPRVAIYEGGTLSSALNATLVEDLGQMSGSATGWVYIASSTNPTLTNGNIIWIFMKNNDNTTRYVYSTDSGDAGDFQSARGRNGHPMSKDPTAGWPDPIGAAGSYSNVWVSCYLDYT